MANENDSGSVTELGWLSGRMKLAKVRFGEACFDLGVTFQGSGVERGRQKKGGRAAWGQAQRAVEATLADG